MILILCFSLLVLCATITEQIRLLGGLYLFLMAGLCIFQFITQKSDYVLLVVLTLLFVGLLGSMTWIHQQSLYEYPRQTSLIATGVIVEKNIAKYTILLEDKSRWTYYSSDTYELGDQLMVFARYKAAYTGDLRNRSWAYPSLRSNTVLNSGREYQFDYTKYQLMKGLQGSLYETQAIFLAADQGGWILKIKKSLQQQITELYGSNKISALLLGMLIGDKSLLSKSDYQKFIDTGLVHMIAVSGGNIAILSGFLMIILFFLPYYLRIGVVAAAIIFYCLICGMDSSVVRAMVMGLLSIGALMVGKMTSIWKVLGLTWCAMLLYNPYFLVYDLGFGFSFAAVAGMIILSESWVLPQTRRTSIIRNTVIPSVGATLGVMPLMIFFIGKLNLTGIVGNLFVTPLISLVMIYGYISTYLSQWLGYTFFALPTQALIAYIYQIADLIQSYSLTLIVSAGRMKLLWLVVMLACLIYYHIHSRAKDKLRDMEHH